MLNAWDFYTMSSNWRHAVQVPFVLVNPFPIGLYPRHNWSREQKTHETLWQSRNEKNHQSHGVVTDGLVALE